TTPPIRHVCEVPPDYSRRTSSRKILTFTLIRIWQMVMPAPAFTGAKELIKKAIGSDWDEITRRIPTL
ncbi:MAG: hypothetical protein LUQ38_02760, partial [Methanotrichaceae archaeon]|nr:hypothetical protein [Methanotrichaceae archaeon]